MDPMMKDSGMVQQQEAAFGNSLDGLNASASLEMLEQHQAKEQSRLLYRFKELREWQQQQQQQLMHQQQQQLSSLQQEQSKVQSFLDANQQSGGYNRSMRPNAARSRSPVMTPPCKPRPGATTQGVRGSNKEQAAGISVDSGLVSMQDTLKSQSSLPKPVMYIDPSQSSNLQEEDKYTNSELFSNPGDGDHDDDDGFDTMMMTSRENNYHNTNTNNNRHHPHHHHHPSPMAPDWMSDTSENFVAPKLPPPRPTKSSVMMNKGLAGLKQGREATTADQLAGLEQLLSTAPAGLLQKMLTLLPKTSDSISSDVPPINNMVESSASPTLNGPRPSTAAVPQQQRQQQHHQQQQLQQHQQHLQHHQQQELQQQQRYYSDSQSHPAYPSHHQLPPQRLPPGYSQQHAAFEDVNNSRGVLHPDDAHRYFQQPPRSLDHDYDDLSSGDDFAQYVPRALWMGDDDGGSGGGLMTGGRRQLQDEEEDEKYEDGDEDIEEEEGFEDTSQNTTAKEVTGDADMDEADRPIRGTGGAKSFEKLLEEQLRIEAEEEEDEKMAAAAEEEEGSAAPRPRTFLRKGEGIARFNSAPKKPPPKRQEKRSSGGTGRNVERETTGHHVKQSSHCSSVETTKGGSSGGDRQNKTKNSVGARMKSQAPRKVSNKDGKYNAAKDTNSAESSSHHSTAPAKLTLIRNAASRKMDQQRNRPNEGSYGSQDEAVVLTNASENTMTSRHVPPPDPLLDQSPSSKSTDDHDSTELDSLAEFELLEDVADNMSFCSNSSLVRKLVCSDAKDHQDAVKKLQTITESRKQRQSEMSAPLPSGPHKTATGISANQGTDHMERSSGQDLTANHNNNNNNNHHNANTHYFDNNSVTVDNFKNSKKVDNIMVAKPVDDSSSGDITLTDSSSETDEDDDTTLSERKDKNSHDTEFPSGYFSALNPTNQSHSHQPSTYFQNSPSSLSNPTMNPPPPKAIPRKVAAMTTKVNAANDTLSMLQALARTGGFLSASEEARSQSQNGYSYSEKSENEYDEYNGGKYGTKNETNGFHSDEDDEEEKDEESAEIEMNNGGRRRGEPRVMNADLSTVAEEQEVSITANGFDDEAEWVEDRDEDDDDDDDNNPLAHRNGYPTMASSKGGPVFFSGMEPTTTTTISPPYTPPTSKLVAKLFPKLKPVVVDKEIAQSSLPQPNGTATGNVSLVSPTEGVTNRLLRDKLKELETEIERFRSENSNLDRLRREREEGVSILKKQIETFEKEKESELKRLDEFKTEETKKLKRERKLFDSYQKQVRSMPDKRDREEIENIKAQLEESQDELRRKESRWTASVSRLKNRVAEVELENGELKEEVRILEKKRLEWLTAQSQQQQQGKSSSSSASSLSSQSSQGRHQTNDSKKSQPNQELASSSQPPRSSTPTELRDNEVIKPSGGGGGGGTLVTSNGGKRSAGSKHAAPINLRTAIPAVTTAGYSSTSSKARLNHQQGPSKPPGKSSSSRSSFDQPGSEAIVLPLTSSTSSTISTQQCGVRTSGESLPTQNTSVPVMMETTPTFAALTQGEGHHPPMAASSHHPPSVGMDRSAAMVAMEKAVIEKGGNPLDFVENVHSDGKIEKLYKNTAKEVKFPNGTIKEISSDGQTIVCRLANGDVRQIFPDHRVVYIFAEAQIMQTTFPDGLETFQFKNGQIERRYPDGTVEITFPSKDVKYIFPDGAQEVRLTDGTVMTYSNQGERTVEYPSGDREVHTAEYQRREFPDGIVKTIYSDGRHETRFPNGRVRMRDKDGNVIMDQICYR